jgi:GNAT superfamily N-acetyltransferase
MIIKQASIEHVQALSAIFNNYRESVEGVSDLAATTAFVEKIIRNGEATTFIALPENENKIISGFANLYPCYSSLALKRLWNLNDLFIHERSRGQGTATTLIKHVMNFASESQAIRIELKTAQQNISAKKFYNSLGFTIDTDHIYYRVPV